MQCFPHEQNAHIFAIFLWRRLADLDLVERTRTHAANWYSRETSFNVILVNLAQPCSNFDARSV